MTSIPFKTGDVHGGFSECRGAIRVDGDDVVIETQVKLIGMFEQSAKTHRFELTDLEEVRHKRGLFRDRITLRTRPMSLITDVPGSENGALVLRVKRRHRADVDRFLDRLDLWVT